ncbi:uncharacterized protein LOC133745895 [Rosa rugosa]|uniref:uncharacterized protein LOC133745895 n=1 Tax=Rosa rugosa TaxID=74645 RepID=UPI002B40E9AB|nr:uncharacterized protein LOC133745895 [Rosa rugosa]
MVKNRALQGFYLWVFWGAFVIKWGNPWPGVHQFQRRESSFSSASNAFHDPIEFGGEEEGYFASTSGKFGAFVTFNTRDAKNDYTLCSEIGPVNSFLLLGHRIPRWLEIVISKYCFCDLAMFDDLCCWDEVSMRLSCFLRTKRVSRVLFEVSKINLDLPGFPISFRNKINWVYLRIGFWLESYHQSDEDLVGISEYSKKRTIFGAPSPAKKTRHMIELMTTSEDQERGSVSNTSRD